MRKLIKIIFGLVILSVVLIAAGGALLGMFFDPNDYKAEIAKATQEQTGVELKIGGDISWSVFPWIGLTVNQIHANYPGQDTLANLNKAQISVKLPALLSGNVEMSSVVIDGLSLNITKDKQGKFSWDKSDSQQTSTSESTASTTISTNVPLFNIESVQVKNANIRYLDEQTAQEYQLSNVNIESGRITNRELFPLSIGLNLVQLNNGTKTLEGAAFLKGNISLDTDQQKYKFQAVEGNVNVQNGQNYDVTINTSATVDLKNNTAEIDTWSAALSTLKINGKLSISDLNAMQYNGTLTVAPFALNPLLKSFGQAEVSTQDSNALQSISVISTFSGNSSAIKTSSLSVKLDQTTFDGSAGVNFDSGRISLALNGDKIIVDNYLPPSSSATSSQQAAAPSANKERYSKEEIIPVETLKALNLAIALRLNSATYDKMALKNLDLAIDANNGLIKADKINVQLYGGAVKNSLTLDARKQPVKLSSNKSVSGIQIGELLTAMTGEAKITGTLSSNSNVTAQGTSVYSLVNSLNGNANVTITDGVIKDINMAQELCQTINTLSALGTMQPAASVDTTTPFAKMGGNFVIKNGVISNQDLGAQLDAMALKGKGIVDLPKAIVDYQLAMIIQENLFKKTCPVNNRLEGVEWPVRCKGSFDLEPTELCKPDTAAIRDILKKVIASKIKDEIGTKVESKISDSIKEKAGGDEAVKGLIKGLFK
jgi:uncharacterized protein involved in outer membrane biogenesis